MSNSFYDASIVAMKKAGLESVFRSMIYELNLQHEFIGICSKTNKGENLFLVLAKTYIAENHIKSQSEKMLSVVSEICTQFQSSPFTDIPNKDDSPVLAFQLAWVNSHIFPYRFIQGQRNLGIIFSLLGKTTQKINRKDLTPLVSALSRYLFRLDKTEASFFKNISDDNTLRQYISALVDVCYMAGDHILLPDTIQTHKSDIFRLLSMQSPTPIKERSSDRTRSGEIKHCFDFYGDDQDIEQQIEPDEEELEINETISQYSEEFHRREEISKKIRTGQQKDPYFLATKRQFCSTTPGVLSKIELAILASTIHKIEKQNINFGRISRISTLGALCYGWNREKIYSIITNPEKHFLVQKDQLFYNMCAMIPVGWPKDLIRDCHKNPNSPFMRIYYEPNFEKPSSEYLLPLHPILGDPINQLMTAKNRISQSEIDEAIQEYGSISQSSFFRINPTFAKLNLTFQGWGASLGLDIPIRYVISGKIFTQQVMPINYTRISVKDSIYRHHQFLNNSILNIAEQFKFDNRIVSVPWLIPSNLPDLSKTPDSYAGTWSIPKTETRKIIVEYLLKQAHNQSINPNLLHNYKLLFISIALMMLALMRPFEFENMQPCDGYDQKGGSILQKTKRKRGDDTYSLQFIPEFLQPLFWECYENCMRDYSSGAIWCIRDVIGNRDEFNIQKQVNECLKELGVLNTIIRVYGFRHLGRTEHRDANFPEYFLNYKMSHDFAGGEKYNPSQLGYSGFLELNQQVMVTIARKMGIVW